MKNDGRAPTTGAERLVAAWVVALLVVAIAYLCKGFIPYRKILDHQGLAAWAQAVGSVAAILVAVWVANRQARHSVHLWQRQKFDDRLAQTETAFAHVTAARTVAAYTMKRLRRAFKAKRKPYTDEDVLQQIISMLDSVCPMQREHTEVAAINNAANALRKLRSSVHTYDPQETPRATLVRKDRMRTAGKLIRKARNDLRDKLVKLRQEENRWN